MKMIEPLLMEFDRECSATRKCLERIPTEKLGFKPHEKSMTLAKLAWHLATLPSWVGASILEDGYDFQTGPKPPEPPQEASEYAKAFLEGVNAAKAAMVQLDDEKSMGLYSLSSGGKTIMALPRIAFLRTILLNHTYHHRGQLTVYLRLLDIPVPSIYGPSADDNPFAM